MAPFFNTTAKLKAWLKITVSTDDTIIEELGEGVDQRFYDFLGSDFATQAYTSEKYDGNGQTKLWLRHRPITAVASLEINEVAVQAAADSISAGFLFDKDQLYIVQGTNVPVGSVLFTDRFPRGQQNISVTYTAGFTFALTPKSLISAHRKQVAHEYKERDRIGEKSKTLGPDQNISYNLDEWAPGVLQVLQRYKNVVPV